MIELKGKYGSAKIMIDDVEQECVNQLMNMLSHPAFTESVRIMPDTHAGKGSVVGFTMPLTTKVIPNVVGVDIGCGMLSFKVEKIPDTPQNIDREIKRSIPTGTHTHEESMLSSEDWKDLFCTSTMVSEQFTMAYNKKFGTNHLPVKYDMNWFNNKIKQIQLKPERAINSIGTLGGGNHFIEIGESNVGGYWVTIHSGSRKFGENICKHHQLIAKKALETKRNTELAIGINAITSKYRYDQSQIQTEINVLKQKLGLNFDVDVKGLEFLEGNLAMDYFFDMIFAQQYARLNRLIIGKIIMNSVFKNQTHSGIIDSVHNYIDFNDLIIRKGAISSYSGTRSIIPFNMEDGLLIVDGKSNPDWNYSAPHGAGRLMSRTKAKEVLSLEEMKTGMKLAGVFSSSLNKNTIDEAKGAYKPAEIIEMAIEPTATIIERVKPIINIKDSSSEMSWKNRKKKNNKI